MAQLVSVMELTGVFSFVALATVVTFRLAGFPDLSVDGVFTLGAIVFGQMLILGTPWWFSLLISTVCGSVAGMFTALLATKLRIHPLLASVLILIILYSVNLRILGTANRSLLKYVGEARSVVGPGFILLLAIVTIFLLGMFLRTELGTSMRGTGDYPEFLRSIGRNTKYYKIILVGGAGFLVALAGSLLSIRYSFVDISLGVGTVIIGIASLIIGEKLIGRSTVWLQLTSAILGVVLYQSAVAVALAIGINPVDVKLATGVLAIILLATGRDDEPVLS